MDNHPIPQDVTGFQFRLIGNMTVKQFAYVAVGAVSAVLVYYIPFFLVIKIILIPLFIISGVGLAFLPVEGRPIDIMVSHFFKAVLAPTQFIYKKTGGQLLLSTIHIDQRVVNQAATAEKTGVATPTHTQEQRNTERRQQLSAYLTSIHQNQEADTTEATRLSSLFGTPTNATSPVTTPVAPAVQEVQTPVQTVPVTPVAASVAETPVTTPTIVQPSAADMILMQKDTDKIAEDESLIEQVSEELAKAKAMEQTSTPEAVAPSHMKVMDLEKKLGEIMQAKKQLEEELQSLKTVQTQKVITTPQIPSIPVPMPATPAIVHPNPDKVTPLIQPASDAGAAAGFPSLPDVANILLGVVRDSSGNVLPHILVEVKDKDENPVRAFKTNQLGQFLSATPLKEGNYTIILEDAKNKFKFDPVPLTINNTILLPVEVAAHDLREELRKSLFA